MADIKQLQHPDYLGALSVWSTYREVMWAAKQYIDKHLVLLSDVESSADYNRRKDLTEYNAIVKRGVVRLMNSLSIRFPEISRDNLPKLFESVMNGSNGGVDLKSGSMNTFMVGLLEDLLITSRVAVYVDRAKFEEPITRAQEKDFPVYMYKYTAENIWNWAYDEKDDTLSAVLLSESVDVVDDSGLITDRKQQWRLLRKDKESGTVSESILNEQQEVVDGPNILELKEIPLVIIDLDHSIVEDVHVHQKQAVNLASLEMQFCVNHTIALYVEQADMSAEWAQSAAMRTNVDGEIIEPTSSHEEEVRVGNVKGRKYGMNMDSPKFISPDPDILRATMEKRKRIEDDAQKLLQQAVASLTVTRSSAESKRMDDADFTTGLVTVCNALQDAEKSIIRTWNAYEQGKTAKDIEPLIDYPGRFDVHDDSSRSAELELTSKMLDRSPSPAWKKILHARLVRTYHRNGLPRDIEELITKEIERMPTIVLDPDTVIADHTAGFVSDATASTMRGYPPLEAAQAAIDHAERAKRILSAQTSDFGARGVQDADPDLGSSDKEKED